MRNDVSDQLDATIMIY